MVAKRKSGSRGWITVIVVVVILAGIVTFFYARRNTRSFESEQAKLGDITTYYSFSGNVESKNRQSIISDKVMQISELNVKEGDQVKKDDILLKTTTGDEVKSGIDGEVSNISIEEDEIVTAGIKLMDIVDYNNLEISVKVDEYDISALTAGKEATVRIGALQKEINGKILDISREGQDVNGVTYFNASIDLAKDKDLKVGLSAEVKLISNSVKGVVTLPMKVIQFDDNNTPYVLKKNEKGRPVRTDITTGINNGTIAEIKSGVANGETVLYQKPQAQGGMGFGNRPGSTGNNGGNTGNG